MIAPRVTAVMRGASPRSLATHGERDTFSPVRCAIACLLAAAAATPAEAAAPATVAVEATAPESAIDRLRHFMKLVDDDPAAHADALSDAIKAVEGDADLLAADAGSWAELDEARLLLARALLALDRTEDAATELDRAIRGAHGRALPAADYGPRLESFHAERVAALEAGGRGSLVIDCETPCRVFLDERPASHGELELLVGSVRVRIEAIDDPAAPPLTKVVEIGQDPVLLEYPLQHEGPSPASGDLGEPVKTGARKRMLPRWTEALGLALGAGALAAGIPLVAIDGTCPDGADPLDAANCPDVYGTGTSGFILIGLGAGIATISVILLTIDESRVKSKTSRMSALSGGWRF